ncbi:MAG: MFS transporter [Mycobacterium sp.]
MTSPGPATQSPTSAPEPPASRGARHRGRLRWGIIGLAFAGFAVNNIDRSAIAVALPFMGEDLHLTPTVEGIILGWFFLVYALCLLPAGSLVDRFGARLVYGAGGIIWAVATLATAAVTNVASLLGLRFLLGVGEASQYPSCVQVTARWFPRSERATATAIWDMGARVGGVLTLPLITGVIGLWGWRAAFVVAGAIAVVWAVGWLVAYRDPSVHKRLGAEERAYIEAGQDNTSSDSDAENIRWRDLFRYRAVWGLILGFFCFNYIAYFFITWFPSYLVHERGFSLLKLGFWGMIPGIVAVATELLSGILQDRATARGISITVVRKTPLVCGMLLGSIIMLAVIAPNDAVALALFTLSYGFLMIGGPSIGSMPLEFAPTPRHVGALGGIQNCAANLAGFLGPIVTGAIIQFSGSYAGALVVTGVVSVVGALAYLVLVPALAPITPHAPLAVSTS